MYVFREKRVNKVACDFFCAISNSVFKPGADEVFCAQPGCEARG